MAVNCILPLSVNLIYKQKKTLLYIQSSLHLLLLGIHLAPDAPPPPHHGKQATIASSCSYVSPMTEKPSPNIRELPKRYQTPQKQSTKKNNYLNLRLL